MVELGGSRSVLRPTGGPARWSLFAPRNPYHYRASQLACGWAPR